MCKSNSDRQITAALVLHLPILHFLRPQFWFDESTEIRMLQNKLRPRNTAGSVSQCPLWPTSETTTGDHLGATWRPELIARTAAELAAALMASVDVMGASDSVSTVIDRGPVDSMTLPSDITSCDIGPMSSSCHTVQHYRKFTEIL